MHLSSSVWCAASMTVSQLLCCRTLTCVVTCSNDGRQDCTIHVANQHLKVRCTSIIANSSVHPHHRLIAVWSHRDLLCDAGAFPPPGMPLPPMPMPPALPAGFGAPPGVPPGMQPPPLQHPPGMPGEAKTQSVLTSNCDACLLAYSLSGLAAALVRLWCTACALTFVCEHLLHGIMDSGVGWLL
jgi:hypothetical protein